MSNWTDSSRSVCTQQNPLFLSDAGVRVPRHISPRTWCIWEWSSLSRNTQWEYLDFTCFLWAVQLPLQNTQRQHWGFMGVNRVCVMPLVLLTKYYIQICFTFPGSRFFFLWRSQKQMRLVSISSRELPAPCGSFVQVSPEVMNPESSLCSTPRCHCCLDHFAVGMNLQPKCDTEGQNHNENPPCLWSVPLLLCFCCFLLSDWRVKNNGLGRMRRYLWFLQEAELPIQIFLIQKGSLIFTPLLIFHHSAA